MTPEIQRNQGDTGEPVVETVTFPVAVNLTAAVLQFVYQNIDEDEDTVRTAVIVSASPSTAAATSAVVRRTLSTADVSTAGFFQYKWKFTLAGGEFITKPSPATAADDDYPSRSLPVFQVLESISVDIEESAEGDAIAVGPAITVDDLTELAALPWTEVYKLAWVITDLNGILSAWEWDSTIVTADASPNAVVPLTSPLGGGWRHSDL